MSKKRRQHSPDLKAKVGLEALKGIQPVHAIAAKYQVHPVQVSQWNKEAAERLQEVFARMADQNAQEAKEREEELFEGAEARGSLIADYRRETREREPPGRRRARRPALTRGVRHRAGGTLRRARLRACSTTFVAARAPASPSEETRGEDRYDQRGRRPGSRARRIALLVGHPRRGAAWAR